MDSKANKTSGSRRRSLAAAAALAAAAMCVSPILAATATTPSSATASSADQAKSGHYNQSATDFRRALGMPLEDAGGGWHAVLGRAAENLKTDLEGGGFNVNAMELDFAHKLATAYVAGPLPDPATFARYSRAARAEGFETHLAGVWRTEAAAKRQMDRIADDARELAKRGIHLGVMGVVAQTGMVRVDVYDGTAEKADYLTRSYGPQGLHLNIGDVPHVYEPVLYGAAPPPAR
ncbi:hypothetical protein CVV68_02215 [Arthrobacter livingstonensis]|uniref:Uncharacterized protein n=1 Tax=Arthrobacter livingstonensis TaxID=670078 RepID=A0A2V5LC79_9MICC|nr:hypothetical protein [Arthrobacter livingstonensis]PYI69245.1 hypothetical protein CVV68_02215 [Arthrobacter livingstonensis]